jgi:hypothetical protein
MEAILHSPYGSTVLGMGTVSIGTTPDNQLVLSDASVGARHAEIRPEGQGHSIIDLGTSAGTSVNGQKLYPQIPQVLQNGDILSIGSTQITYEVKSSTGVPPTVYATPGSSSVPPTVYGSPDSSGIPNYSSNSSYSLSSSTTPPPPTASSTAVPPPPTSSYSIDPYGAGQPKKGKRGLWITLGVIGGVLVLALILLGVVNGGGKSGGATASATVAPKQQLSPTLTLNAYCDALKKGDYQAAYKQFSSSYQSKTSATQFASSFSGGKPTDCIASSVDDKTGSGLVTMTFTDGPVAYDEKLINQNGTWVIDTEQQHSTPTVTLNSYCNALKQQDYQTAYDQLSQDQQSQQSKAQFVANFSKATVSDCTASADDNAGTGSIDYTFSDGQKATADYTLVQENSAWKIKTEKARQ